MKNRAIRKTIKQHISNTELELTFSVLKTLYERKDPQIFKELIILQGQYQHLRNTKELSLEREMRDIKKIADALLAFNRQLRKVYEKNLPADIVEELGKILPERKI